MASLEDAAAVAMALPEVTEGERHGTRTWSVDGKVFAWERRFSKADLRRFGDQRPPAYPVIATRVKDLDEKDAVLAVRQPGFFTIPHFNGFPAVLIELGVVDGEALREAITDGWLCRAPRRLAERFAAG